jgi:DNA replication and repair protein RecF
LLLVDDIPAELDEQNRNKLMSVIMSMQNQAFITAIEPTSFDKQTLSAGKVFHVEHGNLSEVL